MIRNKIDLAESLVRKLNVMSEHFDNVFNKGLNFIPELAADLRILIVKKPRSNKHKALLLELMDELNYSASWDLNSRGKVRRLVWKSCKYITRQRISKEVFKFQRAIQNTSSRSNLFIKC